MNLDDLTKHRVRCRLIHPSQNTGSNNTNYKVAKYVTTYIIYKILDIYLGPVGPARFLQTKA